MSGKDKGVAKNRLRSAYLTSLISITLVLFLLGVMGGLILNANRLSNHVKENIGFTVVFEDDIKEAEMIKVAKTLNRRDYVKEALYNSREQAAEIMKKELGEDFVDFLGYNPLPATIDVKLFAKYANTDSVEVIEKQLLEYPEVKEVVYQKSLVHLVNENVQRITIFILGFAILLMLVAWALINNTIRLMVYSRRFLINTMKIVGATSSFIRKPFIYKSFWQGLLSGIFANGLLYMCLYYIELELFGVVSFIENINTFILFGAVMGIGIFISVVSTFFAVTKFIRLKTDKLYA